MATAAMERGIPNGPDRRFWFERMWEYLKRLLFEKKLKDEDEAREAQRKISEAETQEKREEARRRAEELDAQMQYQERRSAEERFSTAQALQNAKLEEIKQNLDTFVREKGHAGSGYLFQSREFNEFIRDSDNVRKLKELIDASSHAAYLINELVSRGFELHSNAARLINLSRDLLYEAEKAGKREAVNPLLASVKQQVNHLMDDTIKEFVSQQRRDKVTTDDYIKWFEKNLRLKLPEERLQELQNRLAQNPQAGINEFIDELFSQSPERPIREGEDASWANVSEPEIVEGTEPTEMLMDKIDQIWTKVTQAEQAGAHLTTEQLGEVYREIQEAYSSALPPDLIPGTKTYHRAIVGNHRAVEARLTALANKLNERLKTERPAVKEGITDPQKFLEEMILHPGALGGLLRGSPEIFKLLIGQVPREKIADSVRFKNQVFLTIHNRILTDKHSSSGENFGLYERADFTTFLNILGSEMARLMRPETGTSHGQAWVEWFTNLSSSIRLSRDIDFYASQPGVSIDDWARSFSLFKNELSTQAMALPAVEQAYRSLETTLRGIRDANGGYIPPGMVEYNAVTGTSEWDNLSLHMLENMIYAGVVPDIARDDITGFHKVDVSGRGIALSGKMLNLKDLREQDPQKLEISMYMTLAKGFGLASLRFLEIFANSKVPGGIHPVASIEGFHSTPYEGPARALNYINTVLHKWTFGSYKYMQIMNTLLPNEERKHMDEKLAWKAWEAFLQGPDVFEDKFGKEARRLLDKLNFSGMSSAFGSNYGWRQIDTTIGWSDKQRELMGGPMKILFAKKFAEAKVKEYWVENKYKARFREMMASKGQPTAGDKFDMLWKERGAPMFKSKIDQEWGKLSKDKKVKDQIAAYTKAFVARAWVETTMRSPLSVAHALEVKVKDELTGEERRVRLHNLIAHRVLGIPPEYTKYGALFDQGSAAVYATPTKEQLQYIKEIMSLEEDLAIVREKALKENRELKEEDFRDLIRDSKRREQALQYWKLTQQAIFGSENYEHLYEQLGMKLSGNGQDYDIKWDKVQRIDGTLHHLGEYSVDLGNGMMIKAMLNHELVEKLLEEKGWNMIMGTDSTAFRQMDLLNLGARQWVRAAGDAAAHFHGGEKVAAYLVDALKPNPEVEDLAKALFEIRKIYEGDNIGPAWKVCSYLAHATTRLYGLDYLRFGSPAQLDIWKTRRGVAAWHANSRRKFYDALEHMDVLPPTHDAWGYDVPEGTDVHYLKKIDRADNTDVWVEIITLGMLIALAMTIYRALTAPSEEEEGGGGGRH